MFAITLLLILMGEETAGKVRGFFAPALNWIAKWLPIFYVASLVCLPLAVKGLAGEFIRSGWHGGALSSQGRTRKH